LTGECLKVYRGHTDWVDSILYDEATKRIFSASHDQTIIVWSSDTGEKVGVMEGHRDWVRSLTKVTSTTIASGSNDGSIKLWNMTTLVCIKTILNGSTVYSVAATPDGQYLISGSEDSKVKVWSVATGQCLYMLSHHSDWVCRVDISPDGRFIASGGDDNMFHLLSVSPPFSFAIRESVLVHDGREQSLTLFSDGAIRNNSDLIATVTSTSMCSLVSENRIVIHGGDSVEFTAPSASAAQLWSEVISAVAADLALHPEYRAHSADQMISRYRFSLLQTILFHVREPDFRKHVPREIIQTIGSYCFKEKEKST
jgi:WD40 repeat protein